MPKDHPSQGLLPTIVRSAKSAPRSVEQAIKAARAYFDEHRHVIDSYILRMSRRLNGEFR